MYWNFLPIWDISITNTTLLCATGTWLTRGKKVKSRRKRAIWKQFLQFREEKDKSEFHFPSFEKRKRNQIKYYQLSRREIIQVSNLHCNQRLVLLLNLFHGEYFQIKRFLIKHWYNFSKQAIKKTTKLRKWKWRHWTVVAFVKMFKFCAFHPAEEEWSPTTNPQHRNDKLAAGHYLGAVSVLRKSLPPRTDPSC